MKKNVRFCLATHEYHLAITLFRYILCNFTGAELDQNWLLEYNFSALTYEFKTLYPRSWIGIFLLNRRSINKFHKFVEGN